MSKFLQILCYLVTFVSALGVGAFFGIFIPSNMYNFANFLPGKPLPGITLFFCAHQHAVIYLFLLPWLTWVGLPLVPFQRYPYWDVQQFLLRFSVFISVELFLLFVLVMSCFLPYVGIAGGMSDVEPPLTWFEASMRDLFWISVLLLLIGIVARLCWPRR